MRTIVSVGYGGRSPMGLTTRGATRSTCAAKAAKSICAPMWLSRIAQRIDFLAMALVGQRVGLDGAAQFHGRDSKRVQDGATLSSWQRLVGMGGVFEVPFGLVGLGAKP